MFGFSLQKLLFTAAAIAVVIYGFRWLTRLQEDRANRPRNGSGRSKTSGSKTSRRRASRRDDSRRNDSGRDDFGRDDFGQDDVEAMIECTVCGSYVAASGARTCGRDDCPWPG